ncbi:L,D-transpeptidase family protein [uncultured Phenylobacterium sp.]|uniref:L,D-transpeptidase family protein n=1 Tax=uncultured Phenylobacterium sp. TaxID=349273 RepID=UPI0025E853F5|nr:L,D-transpeptidase family protein [uncultured Phenylobacterium sp.]
MNRRAFSLALLAAGATCGGRAQAEAWTLTTLERAAIASALGLSSAALQSLDDSDLVARVLAAAAGETARVPRPADLEPLWSLSPPRHDLSQAFGAARTEGRLAGWLDTLGPTSPDNRALRVARPAYAALAAAGGWPSVPAGATLRPGERSGAVASLRLRLAAEGYPLKEAAEQDAFDADLEQALRAFQANHAIEADGILGAATRRELAVTPEVRLAQIDANLERWRWLPWAMPADRVEVDTGGQDLTLYRERSPVLQMRAIVGSPKHPTLMFGSRIDAVVFNPPWNVPASIARTELLPAEARRPGLLASQGIRWVDGHLQQRPGPTNSLGLVKFDIQSPFGVYLHDTPGKGLFANPVRAFSHGCMRLQDARGLAAELLAAQGGSPATVAAAIAARDTRRVGLARPIPLFVVHRTVRPGPDGRLSFHPDIYGWDRRLAAWLAARRAES